MIIEKRFISVCIFIWISMFQGYVLADNFYKEAIILGGYSEQDQWVGEKGKGLKNSIGFEYFRKFSDEYGDFLTADLQARVSYDSGENSEDAWAVEIHNAWIEHPLELGKSIRLGHFDPAFGLEPVLDTHGTLLQTLATKNIGFKKDWGIGYRGLLGDFDYEIAGQLGSGMSVMRKDGNFLLSGRISTPQGTDSQFGISFMYGRTLQSKQSRTIPVPELVTDKSVRKKRIGIDLQRPVGPFGFKGEIAAGEDDGITVAGALAELDYTVPDLQSLKIKLQGTCWSTDWGKKNARDVNLAPVIEYNVTPSLTMRLGYFHDFEVSSGDEDRVFLLQLYYFSK